MRCTNVLFAYSLLQNVCRNPCMKKDIDSVDLLLAFSTSIYCFHCVPWYDVIMAPFLGIRRSREGVAFTQSSASTRKAEYQFASFHIERLTGPYWYLSSLIIHAYPLNAIPKRYVNILCITSVLASDRP